MIWDDTLQGFGVKHPPNGRLTFLVYARVARGPSRKVTLGPWPQVQPDDARRRAQIVLGEMKAGVDPSDSFLSSEHESSSATTKPSPNPQRGNMSWIDRDGIRRSDLHRPGNKGGSEIEEDFHEGKAQLVKRPGQKARLERNRISFWVGAVEPDQGREP